MVGIIGKYVESKMELSKKVFKNGSDVRPAELPKVEEFFEAMNFCPINYQTARRAGLYRRDYQSRGITLSISDTLIAAAAIEHTLTLVTKNVRHFPMDELSIIEH